jgi:hypothetical protein
MLVESPGMNMVSVSTIINPDFLSLGDIRAGITITYTRCQTVFPLLLATLTYFGDGTSEPCSFIEIAPDPTLDDIEVVSCSFEIRVAEGGRAVVNHDGSCMCGPPAGQALATIETTPPGLTVTVDGTSYTAPQSFHWDAWTTHSISVAESQSSGPDTIAVFDYWSDGGDRTHDITVPDGAITYRATHHLEYGKTTTGAEGDQVPSVVVLKQNAPNPFNPTTRIEFSLPSERDVRLDVFDVQGKLVRRLYVGRAKRGLTSLFWNGDDDRGQQVGSGVYFYRLEAGSETVSKKMVLLK